MAAKICWICLIIFGLACGAAYSFGENRNQLHISSTAELVDYSDHYMTPAAQRYVAGRASHWKDAILNR